MCHSVFANNLNGDIYGGNGLGFGEECAPGEWSGSHGSLSFAEETSQRSGSGVLCQVTALLVAFGVCASALNWCREIGRLVHEVKLIHQCYVKPFVKLQKNDMADAEAICEAAIRPPIRFVAVKSEETQATTMVLRAPELLVRQRTQLIDRKPPLRVRVALANHPLTHASMC